MGVENQLAELRKAVLSRMKAPQKLKEQLDEAARKHESVEAQLTDVQSKVQQPCNFRSLE